MARVQTRNCFEGLLFEELKFGEAEGNRRLTDYCCGYLVEGVGI